MKNTMSHTTKINAIALEVMRAVNKEKEDHTYTMSLLERLQNAIQETKK